MRIGIDTQESITMPLYSFVPAGYPFPSVDINKKEIDINHFLVPQPASTFLVRVKGDSMVLKGIVDGDFVIVDRAVDQPAEHDIVVASIDGGVDFTIKTLRIDANGQQYLEAANDDYQKIYAQHSLEILGKVIGVFRRMH